MIDGGPCSIGLESTIINMSSLPFSIIRQGALSPIEILKKTYPELKIIGITGQSGSGKTSALNSLKERGAAIFDCDALYHSMLKNDAALIEALKKSFPEQFEGDVLNRPALSRLVFSEPDKLARLNAVTHFHISRKLAAGLFEAGAKGYKLAAIDAIELISSGLSDCCDCCIAIVADKNIRLERIMKRDGVSREDALRRINAQRSEDYFRENCDYIVENNSAPELFIKNFNEVIDNV